MAELKLVEGWTGPIDDVLRSNGLAADLTGLVVELVLQTANGSLVPTAGDVTVVTPTEGVVRYLPGPTDLLATETPHVARWKVTDGAEKVTYFPNDAGEVWTVQPTSAVTLQDNALLTIAELKAHLKIQNSDQDLAVAGFINACSDALETHTGRRLKSRTYIDDYTRIDPMQVYGSSWFGTQSPITALTSLTLFPAPGLGGSAVQTLWMPGDPGVPTDFDVYVLEGPDPKHARDRLYRPAGWPWGALVKRTYTAGYGSYGPPTFPIPGDLKEALAVLAEDWYYKRDRQADPVVSRSATGETVTFVNDAIPRRYQALIAAYRRWD